MIKFFRKIRRNLVMESNTGKYFKYAIGEIILVVIGILIALQINNWHENRQKANEIESLMQVFENELNKNIEACNLFIEYGFETDSISSLYKNEKITKQMLADDPYLEWGFGTNTQQFADDRLSELISVEKRLPNKYKKLITDLKELKRRIESQRSWEKKAVDLSLSRFKEMTDTLPWMFKYDSISRDKARDYYLTDEIYKNKVLHYNTLQLSENVWDATLIRSSSVVLLWQLKKIRTKNNALDLKSFLISKGLEPFEELDCSERPFKNRESISFGRNFILYNNSDKEVLFNVIETSGELISTGRLKSKSILFNESVNLSTNRLIERVDDSGSCVKVYRYTKEDFLIFD